MAKNGSSSGKKRKSIVKLKVVVEKLQKSFSLSRRGDCESDESEEMDESTTSVPKDVKEGHFAVIAADDGEPKRFIVALDYLANPSFLRLLEQAEEEFGFDQEGALTIPCRSSELERILEEQWELERVVNACVDWMSCKAMVKGC
ncbi:PREDICTED: auxin-responsive protein SAUR32-like [Nelumbo nucifera]|uniref:Uncharacterized protein n=2 Tax=Nelumbo nucifera TaxID=4432 RepID=A0A822Y2G1_NELNU|nr:PREDICTED: auxin-responsive protein SAUR32-like [Nelumbo nucifera]DAD26800.1 TPA_asm: hypothetical protein HUJ06_028268 [Nelumbo nucifera]